MSGRFMEIASNQNKRCIFLCNPKKCWKSVSVNIKTKAGVLIRVAFNDVEPYICIFKGSIIDLDSTIEQIGIMNSQILIAIKQEREKLVDFRWLKLSLDPHFEHKIQILSNDKVKNEYNRLSDIRNLKSECNARLYKKKAHRYLFGMQNQSNDYNNENLKIDYETPTEPNTDAFPIKWE